MELNKKSIIELLMIILILTDTILLILVIFHDFSPIMLQMIYVFDIFVCIILSIEFVYNLKNSNNRKEFFKNNWFYTIALIPDYLLSLILSLFGLSNIAWIVRLIRLLRIGRVLILFKKNIKMFTNFIKETHLDKLLTFVIILVMSLSIAFFVLDESANTFSDGLWYVLVTLATVGYGDLVPTSTNGRIIGFILIIVGIITFSVLTAAISSIYTKRIEKENQDDLNKRLDVIEEKIELLQKMYSDNNSKKKK